MPASVGGSPAALPPATTPVAAAAAAAEGGVEVPMAICLSPAFGGGGGLSFSASEIPTADKSVAETADEDTDEDVIDESLRQYLDAEDDSEGEDDTAGHEEEDSGEDSDEDAANTSHIDRHKNDMEMLLRQQHLGRQHAQAASGAKAGAEAGAEASAAGLASRPEAAEPSTPVAEGEKMVPYLAATKEEEEDEESDDRPILSTGECFSSGSPSKHGKKNLLSRIFKSSGGQKLSAEVTCAASMLKEPLDQHDENWYEKQLKKLASDGMSCTKVATNGKPYERRLHVDARNLQVEIRGGRTGSTGVLLDDLVDIRRGLASPELEQFYMRVAGSHSTPTDLASRALVLQTPNRTFSFLLSSDALRGNLACCILHLLKSKNRGVMAKGIVSKATPKPPKSGKGSASYPNGSTYEGQFADSKRHGYGVLTLSDATRYESQWQNDERHGDGQEFCPDKTTFTGSYVKGMRHGSGVMTWPEGSKYTGQFERGRANGEGELVRTDGSVYRGLFAEDCMCGEGCMQWRDGVEYNGQFSANRREGFGKMLWSTGRWKCYEGEWKDGLQHGEGKLTNHQGQEYRGCFNNGKLERWSNET